MDEIKSEIAEHPVLIYMKGTKEMPQCGFSAASIQVLSSYNVPIKDVNVLADQEKWAAVKTFSNWPTIPQIYIGGKFIGGCDILREMHAKGEVAPLLEQALAEKRSGTTADGLLPQPHHQLLDRPFRFGRCVLAPQSRFGAADVLAHRSRQTLPLFPLL